MDGDKSEKKSISFTPALLEKAEAEAKLRHGGVLSRYIQSLIQKDLGISSGGIEVTSPAVLVDLSRSALGGSPAKIMEHICAQGWDQPQELRALLWLVIKSEAEKLGIVAEPETYLSKAISYVPITERKLKDETERRRRSQQGTPHVDP